MRSRSSVPRRPPFPGVRIEAADADPGRGQAVGAGQLVRGRHRAPDPGRVERGRHLAQGNVPGDEGEAELSAAEGHGRVPAPASGEEFGVAGKAPADGGHPLLADGRGDDPGTRARTAEVGRPFKGGPGHEGALPVRTPRHGGIGLKADRDLLRPVGQGGQPGAGPDDRDRGGIRPVGPEPGGHDLGSDARGVAASDGDALLQGRRVTRRRRRTRAPAGPPGRCRGCLP